MPILALIIAFSSAIAVGPTPEYVPVSDEAYTLDLEIDGYVNGAMDKARLMTLEGCTLERDAAYMYALLMEAAERDGINLGWEDCYRSFTTQKAAYDRRCPVVDEAIFETDPLTGEKVQTGTKSARVCSGPPIARAGFSNHGWGRAVDFTDGNGVLSCTDSTFRWLQGNAHRFGWVNPRWAWCDRSTREPWHWEYAGVADATLVGTTRLNQDLIKSIE
ncbi:MAG TPA: M15 family metallopeptidase [Acidimicrobiia bacterium]|nr:M15 family metallopeptidase [Acidimicrobiia bacterium]